MDRAEQIEKAANKLLANIAECGSANKRNVLAAKLSAALALPTHPEAGGDVEVVARAMYDFACPLGEFDDEDHNWQCRMEDLARYHIAALRRVAELSADHALRDWDDSIAMGDCEDEVRMFVRKAVAHALQAKGDPKSGLWKYMDEERARETAPQHPRSRWDEDGCCVTCGADMPAAQEVPPCSACNEGDQAKGDGGKVRDAREAFYKAARECARIFEAADEAPDDHGEEHSIAEEVEMEGQSSVPTMRNAYLALIAAEAEAEGANDA